MAIAISVIKYLIETIEVDCLALGEVAAVDVTRFQEEMELGGFGIYEGTKTQEQPLFDTTVFYRTNALDLINTLKILSARGSHKLRIATRLDFRLSDSDRPLHVFISHWPSRLWCERNGADRHTLGLRLRDEIDEIHRLGPEPAQMILMGDYNDEPFDASLSEQLLATRDRGLLKKKPRLLYNPFWRLLGERFPHVHGRDFGGYSGSYFHSRGNETQWRTFDQIIFSAAFFGESEWHLNEEHTKILQMQPLEGSICSSKEIFDHFPVLGVIEREESNG